MGVPQQPMMNYGYPTDTYCPASGGAHQPVTSRGLMGVILAIVCFPVGFFCCCCDSKKKCKNCPFVIKESWCNL